MSECAQCGGRFRSGEPRVGDICSMCWRARLDQPAELKPAPAPTPDYEAGFAAGIEAAAVLIEGNTVRTASVFLPWSEAVHIAAAIRSLKPEASDD